MNDYKKLPESLRMTAACAETLMSTQSDKYLAGKIKQAADAIEQLTTKCSALESERDAAVKQLEATGICDFCIHCRADKVCKKKGKCSWEWAGPEAKRREK